MKLTLFLLLTAVAATAQPVSLKANWSNVKGLPIGEDIRASLADGKSFRGQVQSVTDEALIMVAANSQQSLARTQVRKIAIKRESHRARNTLIGLGAGAGVGLGIGAAYDRCTGGCGIGPRDAGKIVFTPLGALVGTIAGLAWPTGGWHEVYRSR